MFNLDSRSSRYGLAMYDVCQASTTVWETGTVNIIRFVHKSLYHAALYHWKIMWIYLSSYWLCSHGYGVPHWKFLLLCFMNRAKNSGFGQGHPPERLTEHRVNPAKASSWIFSQMQKALRELRRKNKIDMVLYGVEADCANRPHCRINCGLVLAFMQGICTSIDREAE